MQLLFNTLDLPLHRQADVNRFVLVRIQPLVELDYLVDGLEFLLLQVLFHLVLLDC